MILTKLLPLKDLKVFPLDPIQARIQITPPVLHTLQYKLLTSFQITSRQPNSLLHFHEAQSLLSVHITQSVLTFQLLSLSIDNYKNRALASMMSVRSHPGYVLVLIEIHFYYWLVRGGFLN